MVYCVLLRVFLLNIQNTLIHLRYRSPFFSQTVDYNVFYTMHYWKPAIPANAWWINSIPFSIFFFFLVFNCGIPAKRWKRNSQFLLPVLYFVLSLFKNKKKPQDARFLSCNVLHPLGSAIYLVLNCSVLLLPPCTHIGVWILAWALGQPDRAQM